MDIKWAPDLIADHVTRFCNQKESIDGPANKINMIVTFDDQGVSGHPNHIAIFHGISRVMEKKMLDVELMTLATVHLVRKYLAIIDVNFIWID